MDLGRKKTSIGGDAVRLTVSKAITLGIGLVTSMLLSRFRTLEEYGTYSQMLLVINLVTSLLMLGLPSSINYFIGRAETEEEKRKFSSVYFSLSTLLCIIIGIVLVLAIPIIELYFKNDLISAFWYFLALFPWTTIVNASLENVLVAYKKTRFLMAYRIIHSAAILGILVLVQLLGYGFNSFLISYTVLSCLFAISVYVISYRINGKLTFSLDKTLIKTIFVFSIPIGLSSVVGTLNAEIDKLLIGYLMDTEQLAIYTNAAKELPLSIVASSITAVLLPRMSKMLKDNKKAEALKLWGYATELAFIIICVIVSGVVVYAEDVMTILYSEKYLPGVNVFRIYTLNLLLRITYFGIILNASGETKKIFWCSVLSLVLNAALNPLFYWMFGMIGPAIATFIAILAILLLQLKMTTNTTGIRFGKVFPWLNMGKVFLLNACFAGLFWALKRILPLEQFVGSIVESVILGAVWIGIYFVIMKKKIKQTWVLLNQEGDE